MKVTVSKSGAVCGDEQVSPVEIGSAERGQLELYGPLAQLRRNGAGGRCGDVFMHQDAAPTAGAASAGRRLYGCAVAQGCCFPGQYGGFIVSSCFTLYKRDGPGGTDGQTIPQAVAIIVAQEPGLTVHHADGAFMAGSGTQAAAVAFFFVNLNHLTEHRFSSCSGKKSALPFDFISTL